MPNSEPIPQGLPLIAYAEHLCKGSRVLVSGEAPLQLAEALLGRGARLVHVFEKDALRRAEAEARSVSKQITFSAPDYGLREGFFDLVIIENLAREAGDPAVAVRGYARLLAPRGAVLIAAPNPEAQVSLFSGAKPSHALDYYALYDAVSGSLPAVRMLGQVPFVGYALIDFSAEGEPAPVFDTSLLPPRGEEPDTFVALGSREAKALDGYVVVQLPSGSLRRASEPAPARLPTSVPPAPAPRPEPPAAPQKSAREQELEAQLARQEAWIQELEGRATTADERADAAETEIDELRERYANLEQVAAKERADAVAYKAASHADAERLRRRANDFADLVELKDSEIRSLQAEIGSLKAEVGSLKAELAPLKAELAPLRAELTPLKAELAPLKAELAPLRAELGSLKAELALLTGGPSAADEVAKLETQLKERGHALRNLERDLREAERTGRELVRKLTAERQRPAATGVAARLVEAEAELVSLRWSLQLLGRTSGVAPGTLP